MIICYKRITCYKREHYKFIQKETVHYTFDVFAFPTAKALIKSYFPF